MKRPAKSPLYHDLESDSDAIAGIGLRFRLTTLIGVANREYDEAIDELANRVGTFAVSLFVSHRAFRGLTVKDLASVLKTSQREIKAKTFPLRKFVELKSSKAGQPPRLRFTPDGNAMAERFKTLMAAPPTIKLLSPKDRKALSDISARWLKAHLRRNRASEARK